MGVGYIQLAIIIVFDIIENIWMYCIGEKMYYTLLIIFQVVGIVE